MDTLNHDIREIAPTDPAIAPLIAGHLGLMLASSPACSVHAMDANALAQSKARLFAVFSDNVPVAMGAIKAITTSEAELKSMHVLPDYRRRGLGRVVLDHLVDVGRRAGNARVNLETGSQPAFEPARRMYAGAGFVECSAFEGYRPDPNSVFMTLKL